MSLLDFDILGTHQAAELLDELRAAGWRVAAGGFDSVLLGEAKRSAARAREAFDSGAQDIEWGAAASTILCAAAACESRLSEYLAHWEFALGDLPTELATIRSETNALSQWRILLRYRSPQFDIGSSREYARLGCLFRTRDVVAHRNARLRLIGSVPEQINDCMRQNVLPIRNTLSGEWPGVVLVHEVALWACKTAQEWLSISDLLVPFVC